MIHKSKRVRRQYNGYREDLAMCGAVFVPSDSGLPIDCAACLVVPCDECDGKGLVNRFFTPEPDGTWGIDGDLCSLCGGVGELEPEVSVSLQNQS